MTAVYHGAHSDSPEPALTGYWAHSCSQQAYTAPQSTTLGLHPVIHAVADPGIFNGVGGGRGAEGAEGGGVWGGGNDCSILNNKPQYNNTAY